MPDVLTYRGTIYPWHCDHMGHMNVMWYVGKFDEATWHLFAQTGITPRCRTVADWSLHAISSTARHPVRSALTCGNGPKAVT